MNHNSTEFETHLQNLANIIGEERLEGNIIYDFTSDGFLARIEEFIPKQKNISALSKRAKKICEIGFNAGHSLLLMLMENQTAEYLVFDIAIHQYCKPCLEYLRRSFGNTKINVFWGSSLNTMPKYLTSGAELNYDLIHIDGGHSTEVLEGDFYNSVKISSPDSIIIFDDTDNDLVRDFVNKKLKNNEIVEYIDDSIERTYLHEICKVVKHG